MKLITDYDLGNAINDVNEPYTPLKSLRNNKRFIFCFHLPFCTILNLNSGGFLYALKMYPLDIFNFTALDFIIESLIAKKIYGTVDRYNYEASINLEKLVSELRKIEIDTSYNLLLKSKKIKTKYHFYLNEHTIPIISESKYFFVPTHENDSISGEVILQEHNVSSTKYYLSKVPTQKAEELLNPQKRMNLSLKRV